MIRNIKEREMSIKSMASNLTPLILDLELFMFLGT